MTTLLVFRDERLVAVHALAEGSPMPTAVVVGDRSVSLRRDASGVWVADDLLRQGERMTLGGDSLLYSSLDLPSPPPAPDPTSSTQVYDVLEGLFRLDHNPGHAGAMDVLSRVLDDMRTLFGADRGAVFTRVEGRLHPLLTSPPERTDFSRRLLERLSSLGESTLVDDVADDWVTVASDLAWVLAGPVQVGEPAAPGLLVLESRSLARPYTAEDLAFFDSFCTFVSRVAERSRRHGLLGRQSRNLAELRRRSDGHAPLLTSRSPAMQAILASVDRAAAEDVTVLLTGESGSGKEVVAQAIHARSPRSAGPFVPLHCMALSPAIVESELFGHARGAFSGAVEERMGRLEVAEGGTLFLDEVGELSPEIQVKLLRVLEERSFQRVGENTPRRLNARLVCATNADLEQLMREGRFREDLFYRICVFTVRLPALRERSEDIPALARLILRDLCRGRSRQVTDVQPDAMAWLTACPWPGNVRELRNVIEQALVREEGPLISLSSLPTVTAQRRRSTLLDTDAYPASLDEARALFERRFVEAHLRRHGGNMTATARDLGTSRWSLYRKLGQVPPKP